MKTSKKLMAQMLLIGGLSVAATQGYAQSNWDETMSETEEFSRPPASAIDSEQFDVSGRLSPSERARRRTEKVLNNTLETDRVRAERKRQRRMNNVLRGMFNGDQSADDSVSYVAAAPVATKSVKVVSTTADDEGSNKMIFGGGYVSFSNDDIDDLNGGQVEVALEKDLSERFSMGVGFRYLIMDTIVDHNMFGFSFPYTTPQEEVNFTRYALDIYAKGYLASNNSRVRPYIGGGFGFENKRLELNHDNSLFGYGYNYYERGDKKGITGTSSSAFVSLGGEVLLGRNIGLNLHGTYRSSLSSGFKKRASRTYYGYINRAEELLRKTGKKIEDSSELSLGGSLLVRF